MPDERAASDTRVAGMTVRAQQDISPDELRALMLWARLDPTQHDLDAMLAGCRGLQRLLARLHRDAGPAAPRPHLPRAARQAGGTV